MDILLGRYDYYDSGATAAAVFGFMLIYFVVIFGIVGLLYMGIFTKAGRPAWEAFVPFYNGFRLVQIAGRPGYWFLFLLIPFVNIVFAIIVLNDLAKSFGKDSGYTVGLVLLPIVFVPMLSYGSARYLGPAAAWQQPQYGPGYGNAPYPQQPHQQPYPPQAYGQQPQQPYGQQPYSNNPHNPTPPSS